jgi:hypothetical protein
MACRDRLRDTPNAPINKSRARRARVRAAQERMGAVTAPRPGPGSGRLHAGPDDPRRARMRTRTRAHRSARGPSLRRTIVMDGHRTARKARTAATSPATLRALPTRALHPCCARTHRRGRSRVARPWALGRGGRHRPLPHPLGRTPLVRLGWEPGGNNLWDLVCSRVGLWRLPQMRAVHGFPVGNSNARLIEALGS